MKILNKKKLSATDQDKHTIRLLRQEVYLNDQMKRLGIITAEEYENTGRRILKTLMMLEAKYEIK